MPEPALFLAFIAAATLLVAMPGPNVAVIVANSLAHGPKSGLLTVAGTSSAMVLQLALTVAGMATVLSSLAGWFEWLRWIGVAYLVYLGVKTWRSTSDGDLPAADKSSAHVFLRGFLVSLTNPKTLLFYAAFLPQFVSGTSDPVSQLLILSAAFLVIAMCLDSGWALLAGRLRPHLNGRAKFRRRFTGALLVMAGAGLAMARKA